MNRKIAGLCLLAGIAATFWQISEASCGCAACAASSISKSINQQDQYSKYAASLHDTIKQGVGLAVRPMELPKLDLSSLYKPKYLIKPLPPLLNTLPPVGGPCSCKTTVVSPAIPRPAQPAYGYGYRYDATSKLLQKLAAASSASMSYYAPPQAPQQLPPTYSAAVLPSPAPPPQPPTPQPVFSITAGVDPIPVPSDPVSMQLAMNAIQKAYMKVSESGLAFGFKNLPTDGTIVNEVKKIPEENLLALNGAVVELKPPCVLPEHKDVDDEAEASLGIKNIKISAATGQPTLGQLGYGPAIIQPPPTLELQGATASSSSAASCASASATSSVGIPGSPSPACNDVVPGQVLQGAAPKPETYVFPAPPPPPCSAAEEAEHLPPPPQPAPAQHVPYASYTYSSAANAASSSHSSSSISVHGRANRER